MNNKATPKPKRPEDIRPASAAPANRAARPVSGGAAPNDAGFFSKIGEKFNTALQNSRGGGGAPAIRPPLVQRPIEETSIARTRSGKVQKMFIPDNAVIKGSLSGASEAEIHGRIEGDVAVDAPVFLGKNAVVTGSLRATSCQIEGTVQGSAKCVEDLVLTTTGRLVSDAEAGNHIRISGRIDGNVKTPGVLRIEAGGIVNGDVQARVFSMSEGAELNGRCTMRAPAQQDSLFTPESKG